MKKNDSILAKATQDIRTIRNELRELKKSRFLTAEQAAQVDSELEHIAKTLARARRPARKLPKAEPNTLSTLSKQIEKGLEKLRQERGRLETMMDEVMLRQYKD